MWRCVLKLCNGYATNSENQLRCIIAERPGSASGTCWILSRTRDAKLRSFRIWDDACIQLDSFSIIEQFAARASCRIFFIARAFPSLANPYGVRVAFYSDMKRPRVVIVGGGFGGLYAAQSLKRAPVDVTLLDRRNFHLFQPLLYQVATGWLSPANIASPLRVILRNQKNARVFLAEVVDFDLANRSIILTDGQIDYDTLIVASGSGFHYFGHEEWQPLAPGLKTVGDDTDIRRRIFQAFEAAERETDADDMQEWLTFVIVGGGRSRFNLGPVTGRESRCAGRPRWQSHGRTRLDTARPSGDLRHRRCRPCAWFGR